MKSAIDSRARFVETAAALFQRQGYHGTGLNQIIKESGAPRGSLYFHFPGGKEELATAAIEASGALMRAQFDAVMATAKSPLAALKAVTRSLAENLEASDFCDGCPVATVALETAAQTPALQAACSASFERWHQLIAELLVGYGATKSAARAKANLLLCAIEGALVLSRAHRSTAPLRGLPGQLAPLL